jgi:MFS family permease
VTVRRLVLFSSAVVLVETIFFAALSPLLPTLADELELAKWQSGLLVAMYALGGIAGAIPGGIAASRIGVRTTVLAGLAVLAGTSVAFGLVESYWALCLTRFVQGFGGALCWTAALAWLVSAAPRDRRGELIGVAMAAAIGGALLGPVLGGAASHFGREQAFAGVAVLAGVLALAALRLEPPPRGERQPLGMLLVALRSPRVLAGMWLLVLPAMLFGTLSVLAPLQLDRLGWSTLGVAATFLVSAAIEASLSPAVGRWSDRRGRLAPIRFGLVAATAVSLAIPWIGERWLLSVAVVLAGMAYGVFWAPSMAMLSDGWEAAGVEHGLGFALMNFAWAPGNVVGTAVGGAVADAGGDVAAYALLAGLCTATLVLLRARVRRPRVAARAA